MHVADTVKNNFIVFDLVVKKRASQFEPSRTSLSRRIRQLRRKVLTDHSLCAMGRRVVYSFPAICAKNISLEVAFDYGVQKFT